MRRDKRIPRTLQVAAAFEGARYGHVAGDIVRFRGDGSPLRSLTASIDPVQDLHGYDAPWPAGGGENILDPNIKFPTGSQFGLTLTSTDGYTFSYTGKATSSGNIITSAVLTANAVILPAGTYISKNGTLALYNTNGAWLRNQYSGIAFTVDEPFFVRNVYWEIVEGRTYNSTDFIALAKGSTAPTEWTPYSNICPISGWTEANVWIKPTYDPTADPTATIQLGQTVYGGYISVSEDGSAELVVTNADVTFVGDEAWAKTGAGAYYLSITGYDESFAITCLCSHFKPQANVRAASGVNDNSCCFLCGDTQKRFYIRYDAEATATDFKSFLQVQNTDGTPVHVAYKLATPITIPLSDITISTLAGQNVMWADCGEVDVEYVADNGVEGGKLALLLRNRPELLIAMRKGGSPQELLLAMGSRGDARSSITPVRPGLEIKDDEEELQKW